MRFIATHFVFLGFLLSFSIAQGSQDTQDPETIPACSTMLSIVLSCESKLLDANTITASVYSCFCFDGSGQYIPTVYDDAVAGCSSAFPDASTDFDFWLPGFCTSTNYGTFTAAASSTTAGSSVTGVVGLTSTPTVTTGGGAGFSSSPTLNPGGLKSTTTSSPISITPAPTSTGAGAVGHVSSTSSKAEGMKIGHISGDAPLLSILGSILGAILIL